MYVDRRAFLGMLGAGLIKPETVLDLICRLNGQIVGNIYTNVAVADTGYYEDDDFGVYETARLMRNSMGIGNIGVVKPRVLNQIIPVLKESTNIDEIFSVFSKVNGLFANGLRRNRFEVFRANIGNDAKLHSFLVQVLIHQRLSLLEHTNGFQYIPTCAINATPIIQELAKQNIMVKPEYFSGAQINFSSLDGNIIVALTNVDVKARVECSPHIADISNNSQSKGFLYKEVMIDLDLNPIIKNSAIPL